MKPEWMTNPHNFPAPKADGVIYRVADQGTIPKNGNDRDVKYELRSMNDELFSRREDIGKNKLFAVKDHYEGLLVGKLFAGDTHAHNGAAPAWTWQDKDVHGTKRGDFYFRPAEMMKAFCLPNISTNYLYNEQLATVLENPQAKKPDDDE